VETVLLVEDEDIVLKLLRTVLMRQGYTVIAASHAVAALAISRTYTGRIDLLMTDVVMPQMSGDELAMQLRDTRPDTRVLFMSGWDQQDLGGTLAVHGSFIQKPFTPIALAQKVRDVLDAAA
jgi:DNA-binding response OmpR family regulator